MILITWIPFSAIQAAAPPVITSKEDVSVGGLRARKRCRPAASQVVFFSLGAFRYHQPTRRDRAAAATCAETCDGGRGVSSQ